MSLLLAVLEAKIRKEGTRERLGEEEEVLQRKISRLIERPKHSPARNCKAKALRLLPKSTSFCIAICAASVKDEGRSLVVEKK